MKISPKVREFLCLTAHPEGCQKNVENQITYVKKHSEVRTGQESPDHRSVHRIRTGIKDQRGIRMRCCYDRRHV